MSVFLPFRHWGMTTFNKYLDNPTVRITLFVGGIDEKVGWVKIGVCGMCVSDFWKLFVYTEFHSGLGQYRKNLQFGNQDYKLVVSFRFCTFRLRIFSLDEKPCKEQFRALEEGVDIVVGGSYRVKTAATCGGAIYVCVCMYLFTVCIVIYCMYIYIYTVWWRIKLPSLALYTIVV